MKILIYGGSFDPAHNGHYNLLKTAVKQIRPDKTHVFCAWQSPYKEISPTPFKTRQQMAREVLCDISKNIIFDDFENKAARVVYTWETIKYVRGFYPGAEVFVLVGSDCLETLSKWKNVRYIFDNAVIAAGKRSGFDLNAKSFKFTPLDGRFPRVSSAQIRLHILLNGTAPDGMPAQTKKLIEGNLMYGLNIHEWLRKNLKPSRYQHVKLVAREAVLLAEHYKTNTEKLALCGILHDCGKTLNAPQMIEYCKKHKIKIPDFKDICKHAPELLHGAVSEHIARRLFKVKDKDVLNAIKYHTLGRANMSVTEKLLYIADMSSGDRPDAAQIKQAALNSIDEGFVAAMSVKLNFTIRQRKWLAPAGVKLWNEFLSKDK